MNFCSIFIFYCNDFRKSGRFTFERSLIFKFEMIAILFKILPFEILTLIRGNLEQQNVEPPIFRNFKIANIEITKDELFDNFIFEFIFEFFRNYLNSQNIE